MDTIFVEGLMLSSRDQIKQNYGTVQFAVTDLMCNVLRNLFTPGSFLINEDKDWYGKGPVLIPGNLSLPGSFDLGSYGNQYFNVKTAEGDMFVSCPSSL